jgi:hypothetical protein
MDDFDDRSVVGSWTHVENNIVVIVMKLGIDFNEASTLRGLMMVVGCLTSVAFLSCGEIETAVKIILWTMGIVGTAGLVVKDQ